MNYTENYHLPQWEKTDRIMMDDFNQMCADMEAGLTGNAAEAAEAAAEAMAKANEAFRPGYEPFLYSSYVGTGKMLKVPLPFAPRFIIVSGAKSSSTPEGTDFFAACGRNQWNGCVSLDNDGFTVFSSNGKYPELSQKDRTYHYLAFR